MEERTYMEERLHRLQELMKEEKLAGILFLRPLKEGYDMWLTGRTQKDAQVSYLDKAMLAVAGGEKILSISTPSLIEAGAEDPWLPHALPGEASTPYYVNCTGFYGDYFRAMLKDNPRLGLVNGNKLLLSVKNFIQKYAPNVEFVDVDRKVHLLKAVKTDEEAGLIRRDCRDLERAFAAMGTVLRPNVTERDVISGIRKSLLERGANGWDYSSQCLDVKLTSAPMGKDAVTEPLTYPGRVLGMGDRVNIKVNASMAEGWQVSLGRCYVLGEADSETKECWELAVKAQRTAAEHLKPGSTILATMKEVNETILKKSGFPEDKSNWIYGVGNAWAEYPMAVPGWWDTELREGMILAVGPNVKPEGKDAYCCLDIYRITESGAVRLGGSSQELKELFATNF